MLRQLKPPLAPVLDQLVRHLGYPEIVSRPDKSPAEVLIRFEGWTPILRAIRSNLIAHERKRGVPWTGELGSFKISRWSVAKEDRSIKSFASASEGNGETEASQTSAASEHVRWRPDDVPDDEMHDPGQSQARRYVPPSFIVGLQTEAEASAFVRYWHRRSMDVEAPTENPDISPLVNAEILW